MNNEVEIVTRERLSITLPRECVQWIDQKVSERKFFSRSHCIEVLILEAMKREKQ